MTKQERIKKNLEKVVTLLNKNIDLEYALMLEAAERFTHEEINVGTKKKPVIRKVKIMHYTENFTDEDTGDTVPIQRKWICEVDGRKSDGWAVINYHTLETVERI
ncbi:hypothetical protein GCM10007424_23570 [Flavobacterium suaedae]|uniref:Uncharacterized protein n=1 Tax=Flavobacterium suaedae TaxID=1767027 RepID=A0ABQ1K2Z7_9FLAO|nr:hypothetical protein [Flavobacterium suaedae]GGB82824.1 hypothetical protein GCM10007424_23570 [Flavobacterium suaedae]